MFPAPWRRRLLAATCAALPLVAQARAERATVFGFDPQMIHHDPGGAAYLSVRDSHGIFDAMEHGDRTALEAIHADIDNDAPGLGRTVMTALCDAALARVRGDAGGADAILDRLSTAIGNLGDPQRSINPFDLMIDLMRSGDQLLRGDFRTWSDTQERLERLYFAPLRAYYAMPTLTVRNTDLIRLGVPAASIPEPAISAAASDTVPFSPWTSLIGNRQVNETAADVTIDGDRMQAVLDTGSPMGSLPRSYVRAHRLRVVARSDSMGDGTGRTFGQDIVLVPSLSIGRTVFTNQFFAVAAADRPIIGLQQLSRLRHVSMDQHRMTFGAATPFPCDDRLTVASLRGGYAASLLFPVTVDGRTQFAMFGSGNNTPEILTVSSPTLPAHLQGHAIDETIETVSGRHVQKVALERAHMTVGRLILNDTIRYAPSNETMPIISNRALHTATLRFDWTEQKACLR